LKWVGTGRKRVKFFSFPDPSLRIPKKIAKIFKQLKNVILASFQAKMGRDKPKKRRKKKFLARNCFYPTRAREFRKKITKKFKKLKNIIFASFHAEMGRDRPKKSENFSFPDPSLRIAKKKYHKIKKHHPGFISSKNGSGQADKERKFISHLEPFLPNPS